MFEAARYFGTPFENPVNHSQIATATTDEQQQRFSRHFRKLFTIFKFLVCMTGLDEDEDGIWHLKRLSFDDLASSGERRMSATLNADKQETDDLGAGNY